MESPASIEKISAINRKMDEPVKKAVYFMADISGFSGFVENTAIKHSIQIISELLETLLDNNVLEMNLVEIEGDALFMFSEKTFDFKQLEDQVSKMLMAFRQHLINYDQKRICNCKACSDAINLKLKFIIHFGRLDFIKVREIIKPYGKDVNRVHRLLKNDIPKKEYLLLSSPGIRHFKLDHRISDFEQLASHYDIKMLPYYYKDLEISKND
ncbi:hypothetical protein C7S20_07255 [Christiangramia fulva]|uniref:DUF2652 domain-containing protein n=1 Tax=Christiangramia fulva TaxID=2126553 RepID=A0A2R3Z494_9FLAO|nr:DUF2652 domain-containing protein [Christiangramia fulva]AVR45081.1 hypothetical protein C7S20_07255 [Christiangramia fulva]